MGLTYNKEFVSKDRRLSTSGPRDRQLKQTLVSNNTLDSDIINALRSQIADLQSKLSVDRVGYTDDQVNDLIYKAVKEQTTVLLEKINTLEMLVSSLRDVISAKDDALSAMKSHIDSNKLTTVLSDIDSVAVGRPVMDSVYVDPLETNSDSGMTSFIDVDSQAGDANSLVNNKVNKLKNLLGNKLK